MRDEQTGSWWQQIYGQAIQGPLKGQKLTPVDYDEVTYAVWKHENRNGRVLRPEPEKTESSDWETRRQMRVTTSALQDDSLSAREVVVGITINSESKAYPFAALQAQCRSSTSSVERHRVVLMRTESQSVSMNRRRQKLEFEKPDTSEIVDAETGSTWDFSGRHQVVNSGRRLTSSGP